MESPRAHKIVLLGAEGVGKSSLMYRISQGKFKAKREATIGAAFISHNFHDKEDGTLIPLHFWDTAGHQMFNHFLPMYIKGALVVLIVFHNFQDLLKIEEYVEDAKEVEDDIHVILVPTKIDLSFSGQDTMWEDLLDIPEERLKCPELKKYAKGNDYPLFFTSSKTGQGVKELVEYVASLVKESTKNQKSSTFLLAPLEKSRFCCF